MIYRTYQMSRIIEVASLIHNEPRRWTRPKLAERFEVTTTTIQRDINILCNMGIEIVPCGKKGYEIISDYFLPSLNLDFKEALALIMAANFYRAAEGNAESEVINSAIHKITSILPKPAKTILKQIASQIDVPKLQMSDIDEKIDYKEELFDAIRKRCRVTIEYNSFSSGMIVRHRFSPYVVLFRKRAWYVIGRSETSKSVLTFRINRITSLTQTHATYSIPEDFSIQAYLARSWDVMLGPETDVVIQFAERIAPLIREVNWHASQRIQDLAGGDIRFEVNVAGWQEIGWWILSWGHEAEVIKPKALRDWVADTARRMVQVYE